MYGLWSPIRQQWGKVTGWRPWEYSNINEAYRKLCKENSRRPKKNQPPNDYEVREINNDQIRC